MDELAAKLADAEERAKKSLADYQAITTEAFAWLRWMRQMSSARVKQDPKA